MPQVTSIYRTAVVEPTATLPKRIRVYEQGRRHPVDTVDWNHQAVDAHVYAVQISVGLDRPGRVGTIKKVRDTATGYVYEVVLGRPDPQDMPDVVS
jgi:hypothetical protein